MVGQAANHVQHVSSVIVHYATDFTEIGPGEPEAVSKEPEAQADQAYLGVTSRLAAPEPQSPCFTRP